MREVARSNLFRRGLFVGLNCCVVTFVFFAIVRPVLDLFVDRDQKLNELRVQLAKLKAIADQGQKARELGDGVAQLRKSGELFVGNSESAISADIQTRVKGIVGNAGAQTRSAQALAPKSVGKVAYGGARIDIVGPLQSIHQAIYSLEANRPYIFISDASLRLVPAASGPTGQSPPLLQAQLDIYAAMYVEAK
jgi:hypothetical protein